MKFNLSRYILFLLLFFILYIIQIHLIYTIFTFSLYNTYCEWNKIYFSCRVRIDQINFSFVLYILVFITNLYIPDIVFLIYDITRITEHIHCCQVFLYLYFLLCLLTLKMTLYIWIKNQKIKRWGTCRWTGGRDILTKKKSYI